MNLSAKRPKKLKSPLGRLDRYIPLVAFAVERRVLDRLEWPEVIHRLAGHCRLAPTRRWLEGSLPSVSGEPGELFEATAEGVQERLRETSEARALLDNEQIPPLGSGPEIEEALDRARRGGLLAASDLRAIGECLAGLEATARFARGHNETAPTLASLAEGIEEIPGLQPDIERCIDPSGEISDRASPELARARRDSNTLAGSIQKKLNRTIQDPEIAPHLTDRYVTVRNDRYVVPVRADARGRVGGIVHDASNSGATLFVEPQAVVDLNNRLKQAELEVVRETQRVLRALTQSVHDALPALQPSLRTLSRIDWAFSRGRLSQEMDAVEPTLEPGGTFELLQLRHPLLRAEECVPNDIRLGQGFHVLVLSGPNAGGKTVAMKAIALATLFTRAGLHVTAAPGARIPLADRVLADIGDEQDIRESLSTFSAHMGNLAAIVRAASRESLVVLDEIGVGTDPGEGAALAQAVLEALADSGVRVVTTTHYNLLKEMADIDERFCNASVEFDPETLAPTYRLRFDVPGSSSARAVASRMGMPQAILDRANGLLERDDRQLDRMLSELSTSRATLEQEQREVQELRSESEATRDEYRSRLERLQERRDKLFQSMRQDLDEAFRDAHDQVAQVIRDLQRRGREPTAQDAAAAREKLLTIEAPHPPQSETAPAEPRLEIDTEVAAEPVDWTTLRPGDEVILPGGGTATLQSLPDTRGRVVVQAGSARIVVPADQVQQPRPVSPTSSRARRTEAPSPPQGESETLGGGNVECHLRGLRVDEALALAEETLDRALAQTADSVTFIHGIGTGALRDAIQGYLRASPYVADFRSADREAGGAGVTVVALRGAKA